MLSAFSAESTRTSSPRVLIIGAGLGGLALAQRLKQSSIPVSVYERDAGSDIRDQGYRLTLRDSGAKALRACLPAELFELAVATSIRQATRMVFMDQNLTPFFDKDLPLLPVPAGGFGVNRLTLREILATGLEQELRFGKTFDRYESSGSVRAWFEDGTAADGNLLVGADGTGSRVRRQLVPAAVVHDVGYALYGKTPIRPDTLGGLPATLTDSFNRVTGANGLAMSVVTCRPREPYAEAVARLAPEAGLTTIPDYLSWTISLPDDSLLAADKATLHQYARTAVEGWDPALGRIVDGADIESTFVVGIRSAQRVDGWADEHVTLLGDAIHTMSPGRGEGASVALRDAELLASQLAKVAQRSVPLGRAKAEYEASMLDYGFVAVNASLNQPFAPFNRGR